MTALQSVNPNSQDAADMRRLVGLPQSAPTMRQVAARTGWPTIASGTNTQAGFRSWNYLWTELDAIRIWFYNGAVISGVETGSGGDATFKVAVEYPRGVFSPLTTKTITNNGLDYLEVNVAGIPAKARFRIGGEVSVAGAGRVTFANLSNILDIGSGDEYLLGAGGIGHAQDSTFLGGSVAVGLMPVMIQGISNIPVRVALGDSITAGVEDRVFDPAGGRGLFGRSLARLGPYINVGAPGDSAFNFVDPAKSSRRQQIINDSGAIHGGLALGTNDIFSAGRTRAQLEASRQYIRQTLFPNIKWLDTTLTPRTTTTDNWQTAANQAALSGASFELIRQDFNNRLRIGIGMVQGSYGTIDITSLVETIPTNERGPVLGTDGTTSRGVWIPGLIGPTDGTHENSVCLERLEPMITRAFLALG